MTDNDIVKVLEACRPIYFNLHDHIGHFLNEREMALLGQFKFLWEDGLCLRLDLITKAGITLNELAFLAGYIYYSHRLVTN